MCDSNERNEQPPLDGLELRVMTESDVGAVLAIERRVFPSPWRREHFVFEIRENRWAINRVAVLEERIVGYTSAWKLYGELKINNIAVDLDRRAKGLGSWMLRFLLRDAARDGCTVARLEVRPSNVAALRMYRNHGFEETGRRSGYYQREGEDAILMESRLDPNG